MASLTYKYYSSYANDIILRHINNIVHGYNLGIEKNIFRNKRCNTLNYFILSMQTV